MIKNLNNAIKESLSEQWDCPMEQLPQRIQETSGATIFDTYLNYQGIIGFTSSITEALNLIQMNALQEPLKGYVERLDRTFTTPMELVEHLFTELTKGPPLPDPASYGYVAQILEHHENVNLTQVEYYNLRAIQLLLSEGDREVELVNGDDGWHIPLIKGEGLFHITVQPFSGRLVYAIHRLIEDRWVQCKPSYTFYEVQDFVLGEE